MLINHVYGCRWFKFGFRLYLNRLSGQEIKGITNRCLDGKYVVFLDYDGLSLEEIDGEVRFLMDFFRLGNSYLIQSSPGGFHFVCPDKLPLVDFKELLRHSSGDLNHIMIPLKTGRKQWVLRVSKKDGFKPKIIKTYVSDNNHLREKSTAHLLAIERAYGVTIFDKLEDNCSKMFEVSYYV